MSKRTWLEEQIISAKQETENWSDWKREAMRIDDKGSLEITRTDGNDDETSANPKKD